MNKETYDSLTLTRWLDKSGKPIEVKSPGSGRNQKETMRKRICPGSRMNGS